VSFGQVRVQLQRAPAGGLGGLEVGPAGIVVHVEEGTGVRDPGIRQGILRIDLDRPVEEPPGRFHAGLPHLVVPLAAPKVILVGLDMVVGRLAARRFLALGEPDPELPRDRLGDLVLHREDILQLAIVPRGPEVVAVRHLDQLRGDPEPVPRLAHAALEDGAHLELAADLGDVFVFVLEGEGRGAGCDAQRFDLGQRVDDLFGDSVGEKLVLRVRAHIGKRQHRDGAGGTGLDAGQRLDEPAGRREAVSRHSGQGGLNRVLNMIRDRVANRAEGRHRLGEPLGHDGLRRRPSVRRFAASISYNMVPRA
jgi:hypothetical protein